MHWQVVFPLLLFLIIIFGIGLWANKHVRSSNSFLQEYFLGGREMGGFILAMTMIATYGSASSFIGGPGVAYTKGLGWVLLAMAQLPAGYFVLMILGKNLRLLLVVTKLLRLSTFYENAIKAMSLSFCLLLVLLSFYFQR